MYNYEEEVSSSPDKLAELSRLADQQSKAENVVKLAEQNLEEAKSKLLDIRENKIPELMGELNIQSFKTNSGLSISLTEVVAASIPKGEETKTLEWMRQNSHGSLIKREVKYQFGMGQDDLAEQVVKLVVDQLHTLGTNKETVHPSTLRGFVTEKLKTGGALPMDLFNIHIIKRSKIK